MSAGAAQLLDARARLADRVKARKTARAESPVAYVEEPRVSLILLSFNHRDNVSPIFDRLRRSTAEELIVCEDGSIDGSDREWLRRLDRPNEFLVRSNDLHEIRAYNRAIGLSRGRLVCVLQDDDIPPEHGDWITQAERLFERHPRLAVLGGHQGYELDFTEPVDRIRSTRVFGFREGPEWGHVQEIPFADPVTGVPFMFVEGVSVGPIFYRREVFLALGGFDARFSQPGEPGILFDHDISLRAWLAGWQVALYGPAPFSKYVGGQGTYLFGREARRRNAVLNMRRIRETYLSRIGTIGQAVSTLNADLRRSG